jgi:hypothetical protein
MKKSITVISLIATAAVAQQTHGRILLHRHFMIDDKGQERMMIELRMTRK